MFCYVIEPVDALCRSFNSGRYLVVTTGVKRMQHLVEQTQHTAGPAAKLFLFTYFDCLAGRNVLTDLLWHIPGTTNPRSLFPADVQARRNLEPLGISHLPLAKKSIICVFYKQIIDIKVITCRQDLHFYQKPTWNCWKS